MQCRTLNDSCSHKHLVLYSYWRAAANCFGQNYIGLICLYESCGQGDSIQQELRGSTQWLTLPTSCQLTRRRLRLSNCLPRWAPMGSQPGCSHAKWLQTRGVMPCWLRQNLPSNLPCLSTFQRLRCKDISRCLCLSWRLDCWQLFRPVHKQKGKQNKNSFFGSLSCCCFF